MTASNWEWKPRGVGDWLDGMFQVYRGSFKTLYMLAASVLVPIGLIEGLLNPTGSNIFSAILAEMQGKTTDSAFGSGATGGLGIITTLTSALLLAAGIWVVNRYLHGETSGVKDALNSAVARGNSNFARLLGITFLEGFLILLGAGVLVGVFFAIGYFIGVSWFFAIGLILVGLGSIFLGVRWALASQAAVVEGLGVRAALGRSFRLTAGSFWSLFGRFLLYGLIIGAVSAALGVVISILQGAAAVLHSTVLLVAVQGISALINAAVEPLGWIAFTLLYYDLRIRKEGYDLQQRAESLEPSAVAE